MRFMGSPFFLELPAERIVLAAGRASAEDSIGTEVPKVILVPIRIVVSGQGYEPDPIRIGNAFHFLLALGTNESCAWPTFVDLLFRIAEPVSWPFTGITPGPKGRGAFGLHVRDCIQRLLTALQRFLTMSRAARN